MRTFARPKTKKMKKYHILMAALIGMLLTACKGESSEQELRGAIDNTIRAKGDKMVYGLVCDGCTDSTLVFLNNEGGDPVTYDIVRATRNKRIFGNPEIGDWAGIMLNPDNPHEVTMLIDLDQLKGTWTYTVMPTLKDMTTKSEHEIRAELTDSLRDILFVPREYGFALKRQFQASTIGRTYSHNSLDEESIVEYPPVKSVTEWHVYNGKLILVGDTVSANNKRLPADKVVRDTAEFLFMNADSLTLRFKNETIGYRRQIK